MQPTLIPTHVDDPQHLLLWSADEVVPIVLGLVFGMIIQKALICLLIGIAITHQYRKFRDNHPDGYLKHLFYHWGLYFSQSKSLRNPFVKRYIP